MWSVEYKDCLDYIDSYWDKIIHKPQLMTLRGNLTGYLPRLGKPEQERNVLHIPYAYITPNDKKFTYIFYWDTFFMFKGLLGTKHEWIMREMIKNFIYLYDKFGLIPNFNSPVSLSHSQPPLFTSMIIDTFLGIMNRGGDNTKEKQTLRFLKPVLEYQLKKATEAAKKEYKNVWVDENNAFNHHVNGYNLSRYGDRDVGYAHSSELESGWDFTSRFYNRCNYFFPVDLNSYLYKYEADFAEMSGIAHNPDKKNYWMNKANERKKVMFDLMWNGDMGFFYDYSWYYHKQSEFLSLAGFVPLWAGIASPDQAKRMIKILSKFETKFGLAITAEESLAKPMDLAKIQSWFHPAIKEIILPKQWDYPNIWPPLEYLTIIGLLQYGYTKEAARIMKNSLKTHAQLFRKYGTFFEKINAETGEPGLNFHYEIQTGFGWTNAIFYRYIHILDAMESGQQIYRQPQPETPPYELAIPH